MHGPGMRMPSVESLHAQQLQVLLRRDERCCDHRLHVPAERKSKGLVVSVDYACLYAKNSAMVMNVAVTIGCIYPSDGITGKSRELYCVVLVVTQEVKSNFDHCSLAPVFAADMDSLLAHVINRVPRSNRRLEILPQIDDHNRNDQFHAPVIQNHGDISAPAWRFSWCNVHRHSRRLQVRYTA